MSVRTYYVGVGLDPIRFGMSRDDVIAILGQPEQTLRFSEDGSSDPALNKVIEDAGAEGTQAALAAMYKGQVTDIYNEGEPAEDAIYGYISEVTYVQGTVSQITSLDCPDAIELDGINLCGEDIYDVLKQLYLKSSDMYYESTYVYFPKLGIKMSDDADAQRAVFLGDGRTETPLIEDGAYKFVSEDDFLEFYGDDEE